MIKLKDILNEKDEKPDSENPDKILVKNKESGKSYYISKDSFDPSIHEKSDTSEKKKKKDSKEPEKADSGADTKAIAASDDPLAAAFGAIDKKEEESKEEEKKEAEKNLPPEQKLEKKLGSYVFLDDKSKEEIADDTRNMRPDLKKRLVEFEFTPFFRAYDSLYDEIEALRSKKDEAGVKKKVEAIRDVAKRMQGVAVAKLTALSVETNDPKTIKAAHYYHKSSDKVNGILRAGRDILSNDKIEKIRKEIEDANERGIFINQEYTTTELRAMEAINDIDAHFKSEASALQYDTVVFRGVLPDVIKKFIDSGEWVDNGFVSTSLNPLIAENFTSEQFNLGGGVVATKGKHNNPILLRIELKRGTKVLALPCEEDEFCIETELTLARGSHFKITGYDKEKNLYNVTVESQYA